MDPEVIEEVEIVAAGFTSWPEIVGLHIVRANWEKGGREYWTVKDSTVIYKPKIKLHGNNGGIAIYEDESGNYTVEAQSRNKVLIPDKDDLGGFAKWTQQHEKAFIHVRKELKKIFPDAQKTMVFGEWCGMGIQSKVALCQINKKIFAVFSILVDDSIIADPAIIASIFPTPLPENLHIIPWMNTEECGDEIILNYDNLEQLEATIPKINTLVGRIDNLDPWVQEIFKVEGPGEGLVWYPVSMQEGNWIARRHFSNLAFKTKGQKHAVVTKAKPAQLKPEIAAGVPEFVEMFVSGPRCEQGISKVCGDAKPTKANIAPFIKWVTEDVKKESAVELEASKLSWNQVEKEVSNAARKWFLANVK